MSNLGIESDLKALRSIWVNLMAIINQFITLFRLELHLAGKSIYSLMYLALVFLVLLVSSWILVNASLILLILDFLPNVFAAVIIVTMINLILLSIIALFIFNCIKNMSFQNTRKHLNYGWRSIYDNDKSIEERN